MPEAVALSGMGKTRDPLRDIIRDNLIAFRTTLGLSQQAVSNMTAIPLRNLARYEGGEASPKPPALHALSKLYGRPIEDFMERAPPPRPPPPAPPVLHLSVNPGQDVDQEIYDRVRRVIDEANAEMAAKRKRGARSK